MSPMSNAERQQAHRDRLRAREERERQAEVDRGKAWEGLVGTEREKAIRDFWGYAPSETRTEEERKATADRIMRKAEAFVSREALAAEHPGPV